MSDPPISAKNGKSATILDVAAAAGVGIGSVSRVLTGDPRASAAMRERVRDVMSRLDYRPNLLARSLRLDVTNTIGFVIADIANPLFADIITGAEAELRPPGFSLLLVNTENQPDMTDKLGILLQRKVDGLLLCPAFETDPATLAMLGGMQTPIVVIDGDIQVKRPVDKVASDHRTGMCAAVRHLADRGHERIGVLLGSDVLPMRERHEGLQRAERELAGRLRSRVRRISNEPDKIRAALGELLDKIPTITALIVGVKPMQMLPTVLEEMAFRTLRIGVDLALVSFDDIPLTRFVQPGITVVMRDNRELGRRAAAMLLQRIVDPDAGRHDAVLPTELVVRGSSAGRWTTPTTHEGDLQ